MEKLEQDFEQKIIELFSFQRKVLQAAAITAFEVADNEDKLDCITFYGGRGAVFMARAVERHPEDFRNEEISLWDLVALFHLARLSEPKDQELYKWWKGNYGEVDAWTLIEQVKKSGSRRKRGSTDQIQVIGKVVFNSDSGKITIDPETMPAGRSNGDYRIRFARRNKK